MHLPKIINELVSAPLIVILLSGGLIACSPKQESAVKAPQKSNNTVYAEDATIYAEDTTTYVESMTAYIDGATLYADDMTTYIEEVTVYIEDMVYYEFGEYVDDIYVVGLHTQDYIDEHTVIYDPETGRRIHIGALLTKVAIGTAVIIAFVTITAATAGAGAVTVPYLLTIAIPYVKHAAFAAVNAAVSRSLSYIKAGGTIEVILQEALEGAAEGFMWGAILSPVAVNLDKLQFAKAAKYSHSLSGFQNLSSGASNTALVARKVDSAIRPVTATEIIAKYGKIGQELIDDIRYARGYGFRRKIQSAVLNTIDDPAALEKKIEKKIEKKVSDFLKDQPKIRGVTLYSGENATQHRLAELYGLKNSVDTSPAEMVTMINKSSKKVYTHTAFTSTSNELEASVKCFDTYSNTIKILRELRIAEPGVFGADISLLSRYPWQKEVLLDTGLRTKPVRAYLETIQISGTYYEVIHIIEEVL